MNIWSAKGLIRYSFLKQEDISIPLPRSRLRSNRHQSIDINRILLLDIKNAWHQKTALQKLAESKYEIFHLFRHLQLLLKAAFQRISSHSRFIKMEYIDWNLFWEKIIEWANGSKCFESQNRQISRGMIKLLKLWFQSYFFFIKNRLFTHSWRQMILNIYGKLKLLQIKTTCMRIRLDPISTSNSLTGFLLISKIKSNKTTNVYCSQKVTINSQMQTSLLSSSLRLKN